MQTTVPNKLGWYWAKGDNGQWYMTFVDTNPDEESIVVWDGNDPVDPVMPPICFDLDSEKAKSFEAWYGPFHCPGTDFGLSTIVLEEVLHQRAERTGEALVLQYVDFQHCHDDQYHSQAWTTSLRSRSEAADVIYQEASIGEDKGNPDDGD